MKPYSVPFRGLKPHQVYAIAELRQRVFVVEQDCPYPDLDGRDLEPDTRHVLLEGGTLLGYARVLDDGDVWRIGRVVLATEARGKGLADVVMNAAIEVAHGKPIVLDAQAPLASWYATFGFEVSGPEFLEDGIPHLPMVKKA